MTRAIPADIKTLAIEMPSWVGDAIMATPLLRAAREKCPGARIIGLMRPALAELLIGLPTLDERIAVETRGIAGLRGLIKAYWRTRPDAVLLLPNSFRSALAARLGRVPDRVGFRRDSRGFLLTHSLLFEKQATPVSALDYYRRLTEFAFGADAAQSPPELAVDDVEQREADRLLEGAGERFIVINPGATRRDKRWPVERFGEAASRLRDTFGLTIAVTGAPNERVLVEDLCRRCGDAAIDLAARGVSLGALKAVLKRSTLLITNDTGPRHIAAAVGTPCVVLFGPTDHRWTTLPAAREQLLLADPFLPEERLADSHARLCAIDRIPISDVVVAAAHFLSESPARSPATCC